MASSDVAKVCKIGQPPLIVVSKKQHCGSTWSTPRAQWGPPTNHVLDCVFGAWCGASSANASVRQRSASQGAERKCSGGFGRPRRSSAGCHPPSSAGSIRRAVQCSSRPVRRAVLLLLCAPPLAPPFRVLGCSGQQQMWRAGRLWAMCAAPLSSSMHGMGSCMRRSMWARVVVDSTASSLILGPWERSVSCFRPVWGRSHDSRMCMVVTLQQRRCDS